MSYSKIKNFAHLTLFGMGLTIATASYSWNARYVVDAPIRWHSDTNTVGFKIQASSIPPGSEARRGILEAVDILNQNPSNIRSRINPDTEWVSVGNGQNEIWFTDNSIVHGGAPALCISHFNPFSFVWNLMETDVIFNPAEVYTASRVAIDTFGYNGPFRPIQTTALHELGHAMGLEHENRIYNIMGTDWDHVNVNSGTIRATRGPDMGTGLVTMYGGKTGPEIVDLSVSNSKYFGTSGEYSTHQRTIIGGEGVDSYMAGSTDSLDPNQLIFRVRSGQLITPEFTFENNGLRSLPGVRTRFVLSTNKTITTIDRNLQELTLAYPTNRPMTRRTILRIPSDVMPGQRLYLGVIVDSTNTFAETTKRNNATYIPIDIL